MNFKSSVSSCLRLVTDCWLLRTAKLKGAPHSQVTLMRYTGRHCCFTGVEYASSGRNFSCTSLNTLCSSSSEWSLLGFRGDKISSTPPLLELLLVCWRFCVEYWPATITAARIAPSTNVCSNQQKRLSGQPMPFFLTVAQAASTEVAANN